MRAETGVLCCALCGAVSGGRVGGGGGGGSGGGCWGWRFILFLGEPFSKSTIFNCFQFTKSEDHLIYDCIFTVFLNFTPNQFCFNSEPHELVWKSA